MKFIASLILLVAVCFVIMLPYGVGHGLATHETKPMIVGVVLGAIGFALFFLLRALDKPDQHQH